MTNEGAIRKAAEICGWKEIKIWRRWESECHMAIIPYEGELKESPAGIDTLALQLWRKWCDEPEKKDGYQFTIMAQWLKEDSLEAIKVMVIDFDG